MRRTLTSTRTHTVCGHPSDNVVEDILDGDFFGGPGGEQGVQWCRVCGAYRRVFDKHGEHRESYWRQPEGYVSSPGGDSGLRAVLKRIAESDGDPYPPIAADLRQIAWQALRDHPPLPDVNRIAASLDEPFGDPARTARRLIDSGGPRDAR